MRLVTLVIVLLFTHSIKADEYHYKNLLVGTKAIGLGGAFSAISDDLSAVFYNPAGLTNTQTSNSASISTFAWEKSTFKEVFSGGDDFSRSSFSIVPSFLGLGSSKDNWHWGLGFAVSDMSTERNYAEVVYPMLTEQGMQFGEQIEFGNIDLDNASMELAFGIGTKIMPWISIGGALNFKYKSFETVQGSGVNTVLYGEQFDTHAGFSASRRWKDEMVLVAPTIGVLFETSKVNIGLKVTQDFTISRSFEAHHNIFFSSPVPLPPTIKSATVGTITGDEEQEFSQQVSLGFAKRINDFEWSFDIDRYSAVNVEDYVVSEAHPPITRDLKKVTNLSLGLTFYKTENRYFRFGVFTDKANEAIDVTKKFQRVEVIDMMGFSMDYTTDGFGFPLSVGAYVKYGEGKIRLGDIRVVEEIVGLDLYPERAENDVSDAEKSLIVLFVSANF